MPAHVGSQGVERFRFEDAIHLLEEIRIGNVQRWKTAACPWPRSSDPDRNWAPGRRPRPGSSCDRGSWDRGARCGPWQPWPERSRCATTVCAESAACFGDCPVSVNSWVAYSTRLLARGRHLGIVFEVVVAVGQRQTALVNVGDHLVGIVQVRRGIKIEQRIGPKQLHPGDGLDQRGLVFCRPRCA